MLDPALRPARLSPSRASDFMQCPRMYAAKVIHKVDDPSTVDQARGVLVHKVLETLYALPPSERTRQRAMSLIAPSWAAVLEEERDYADLMPTWGYTTALLFAEAAERLGTYFTLEAPNTLPVPQIEVAVDGEVAGVPIVGYIDRADTNPTGMVRLVDYKTGKAPLPRYKSGKLWQLKFYAWAWWRLHGVLPARVRLVFLGARAGILEHTPTEREIEKFEAEVQDLWKQIQTAFDTDTWEAKPSKLCPWCPLAQTCDVAMRR